MNNRIVTNLKTIAKTFAEWDRRHREDPEGFMKDHERLAQTCQTYGEICAAYFVGVLFDVLKLESPDRVQAPTPGPYLASKGVEDEPERWIIVAAGDTPWHIATIENGQPGDTLETEEATAHLFAASFQMLASLKKCAGWADRAAELEVSGSMREHQLRDRDEALEVMALAEGKSK